MFVSEIWEKVEKIKRDVDRLLSIWKRKSLILAKSIEIIFLLSKPKQVYLHSFLSSLPFPKFWKQNFISLGHKDLETSKQ